MARARPASAPLGRVPAPLQPLRLRLLPAHLSRGTALWPGPPPHRLSAALSSERAAGSPPGAPAAAPAPPGARPLGLAAPPEHARAPAACAPIAPSGSESECGPGPGSARRGPPPAQPRQLPAQPPRLGGARLREQKADAAGAAGRDTGCERGRDLRGNSDPLEGQAGRSCRGPGSLLLGPAAAPSPARLRNAPSRCAPAPSVRAGAAGAASEGTPRQRPSRPQIAGASIHIHRRCLAPRGCAERARTPPPLTLQSKTNYPIVQMRKLKPREGTLLPQSQWRSGAVTQTSHLRSVLWFFYLGPPLTSVGAMEP